MFGYIIVNKEEMKFKEFDVYHSYYCGLCRKLKERYGGLGELSLSYDMTFLLLLLTSLYEPETHLSSCKCIAHPFEKHETRINVFTDYIADMNVLLTCLKCQDDWEDDKKLTRLAYGRLLEGKSRKIKELYRDKIRNISMLMKEISDGEKADNQDIDAMSGLFGKVMSQIVVCREDEWSEILGNFGFYLGKFIYLMDAYEDVEEDIRKGRYNPLKRRYETPDFEGECKTILMMMMTECCKVFEQLPIIENVEILRNILYSGIWCRYETVHALRMNREEKKGSNHDI